MEITKNIIGKKQIVKSTDELRLDDYVTIMEQSKNGKRKVKSRDFYKVLGWNTERGQVIVCFDYDGPNELKKLVKLEDIRLHTIREVKIHEIVIGFTCREKGHQQITMDVNDFTFGEQDCDICGSHGNLDVDLKCECGKTHNISLKSW